MLVAVSHRRQLVVVAVKPLRQRAKDSCLEASRAFAACRFAGAARHSCATVGD
jgi:hypothetical protein